MKNIPYFLTIIAAITFISCGKDKNIAPVTPPKDTVAIPAKEVAIGPQTLAEAQTTFRGKWKLQYVKGGYTGNLYEYYPNSIMLFTITDSLYRWDNNVLRINSPVSYFYSPVYVANYSSYMLRIQYPNNSGSAGDLIAYSRLRDTLILTEPTTSPTKYFLTKMQ